MNAHSTRIFADAPAIRERVPLLLGLTGASGTGKTYTALLVAEGIQSIEGGEVFVIDTESGRSRHYADRFKFRHVPFGAPFSPLDYLAAIEQQVAKGAKTVIVDSMSHEHEGPGGVLEMHEAEVDRIAGREAEDWKRNSANFPAWARPKAERRRLINGLLQMDCNFIFCFRAKEKTKPGKDGNGKKVLVEQGWMPIAGEEFIYEMTANMLFTPGAPGVPVWRSEYPGERAVAKLPEQFFGILDTGKALTAATGVALAKWAQGSGASAPDYTAEEKSCAEAAARGTDALRDAWKALTPAIQKALKDKLPSWKEVAAKGAAAKPAADGENRPQDEGAREGEAPPQTIASPDPARVAQARTDGAAHAGEGRSLRGMPIEYREVPELKAAYEVGFSGGAV